MIRGRSLLQVYELWPWALVCRVMIHGCCMRTVKYVICAFACSRTHWRDFETSSKAIHFWNSGYQYAFGRNKKGKVFGTLNQLKNLSKSNDVHAQDKTFLAVRNDLPLPLKIRVKIDGYITFIH